MRIVPFALYINHALRYVIDTTSQFHIDESHGLKHSLEVFHYAKDIYDYQVVQYPFLENQKEIIFVSAILHDMCDKKYMDQNNGVSMIKEHMKGYLDEVQLNMMDEIISTISYSSVKKYGYPDLGKYQMAYHIVREADLLSAYDLDRCLIYSIINEKLDYENALKRVIEVTKNRMLKYRSDRLFITNYSKALSFQLHKKALKRLKTFEDMVEKLY
jgi:HD superfamily phosphodiesterase